MKKFNFFTPQRTSLLALLCFSFAGCSGGPKTEAKVATAIQTMMANILEGFLQNQGDASVTIDCANTGGTISFSDPALDTFDPLNPPSSLSDLGATITVTYTNCEVKACGSTLTLNGSNTTFRLSVGQLASAAAGNFNLSVTVNANAQPMTGLIEEDASFSYILNAQGSSSSLSSLEILDGDADPGPYVGGGITYSATNMNEYVDGC